MAQIQKVFYIAKEKQKFKDDKEEKKKGKVRTTGNAIRIQTQTHIEFQLVSSNGTLRFVITGVKDNVDTAIALLQRRLTENRRQVTDDLPDGVKPLTMENLKRHNMELTEKRQYGCEPCDNVFWTKVFQYKPVARCNKCNVKYDPIPKDKEYGVGTYECTQCGRRFTGKARADVAAMCYDCHIMVLPMGIGHRPRGPRRTRNIHSCQACLNGTIRPCPIYKRVVIASVVHDSSGSTISTFLSQQSEMYYPPDSGNSAPSDDEGAAPPAEPKPGSK
ncbi:shiftless antiviral inhibitor of ribosomal frameshifting protein homolog [Saccoglossus kowalevskii]|uniref:UPF0515 protein C19orf66 homolog n=1 Tax=Saccoglossus kowalevskii TaxID=10224 RepID=A0ABM0GY51_SACKO|nr:PREDICTED: UPF0515 protein C19orf66 homolog [Saccoglossus kowalevskii]